MGLTTGRRLNVVRVMCAAALGLLPCSMLSGCLIAGYSSSGAGFIWPGGLGLLFVLGLLLWLLLRQR